MVKGISRQVVVIRPPDSKLFEQAVFLIRDGALPRSGVTEDDILREANAAAAACMEAKVRPSWLRGTLLRAGYALIGAAATALLFLLFGAV